MRKKIFLIAVFMVLLIISLPICFSAELNLIYDANGNLVTGDGKFREYNSLNQLWRVRNGSTSSGKVVEDYMYHPVEERILMKRTFNSAGNVIERVYYLDENFVRVANSSGTFNFTYVYHEGQLVAQSQDGTKYFIHGDHLGSTSVITNSSGKIVESTSYSPFGEIISGGNLTRYDYTGQEFDTVVGDYDFDKRRYDSSKGQFTSPDPKIQNIFEPKSLNRYSYVANNPFKYIDPDGKNYVALLDPKGANYFGHSAGIVYNDEYAVYYSHDTDSDLSFLDYVKIVGLGRTYKFEGGTLLKANSLDELYSENEDILNRYTETFEIETDKEQDKEMKKRIEEFKEKEFEYNLYRDNCAERQSKIMDSGNIKNYYTTIPKIYFYITQNMYSDKKTSSRYGPTYNDITNAGKAGSNWAKITRKKTGKVEYVRMR